MNRCDFHQESDGSWRCSQCGWRTPRPLDHAPAKYCLGQRETQSLGPGEQLHRLITQYCGAGPAAGCNCPEWIQRMNAWGVAGCREHFDEIVDELMAEGRRRQWDLTELPVRGLAIRTAARIGGSEYLFYLGAKWLVRRAIARAARDERKRVKGREGELVSNPEPPAPNPEPLVPSP